MPEEGDLPEPGHPQGYLEQTPTLRAGWGRRNQEVNLDTGSSRLFRVVGEAGGSHGEKRLRKTVVEMGAYVNNMQIGPLLCFSQ